jgi:hypothetical protein
MTYYNCSSIHVIIVFVRGVLFIFANFCLGWIHVEEFKSFGILRCPFFWCHKGSFGGVGGEVIFKFGTICIEI